MTESPIAHRARCLKEEEFASFGRQAAHKPGSQRFRFTNNTKEQVVRVLLLSLTSALLAACSVPRSTAVTPPAALSLDGVPPIAAALAERIGAYNEFRGADLAAWHPDGKSLLVTFREGNAVQLHRAQPGRPLQLLTPAAEPTRQGQYLPANPDLLIFERDRGGGEAAQIFRRVLSTDVETQLTDASMRHDMGSFSRDGRRLAFTSVPLDRTAAAGTRAQIETLLSLLDPATGSVEIVARLPGPGWRPAAFSRNDRHLLVSRFKSVTEAEVFRVEVASGALRQLLPRAGDPVAAYFGVDYAPDGKRIFVATDAFGEFVKLYRFDPDSGRFDAVGAEVPWDVAIGSDVSFDGRRIALVTNEAGRGVLRMYDGETLRPLGAPPIAGNARGALFSADGTQLAIAHDGADSPGTVSVLDVAGGALSPWVPPDTAGLDTRAFRPTEVIEWASFDGRRISGLITRPPARFAGPRPVLIDIHGGPEAQARLGFNGRLNYLINELGIVLIEPNVRGSRGFGKTFVSLDNGVRREDSVKDIGALLDWIAAQPDLDANRVAVSGGSYGGYMVLASAVHYSDRLRGAVSSVGISHFVSFLERTESYRRDLRRVEYGDERDPQMREFLHRISPLTDAQRIRTPMFVIHGRNDPRVPVAEAEQIVATLKKNSVEVWSLIAENEGHGFGKKENADYAFYARVLFLERVLLR